VLILLWVSFAATIAAVVWTVAIALSDVLIRATPYGPPIVLILMFAGMAMPPLAILYVPLLAMWTQVVRFMPWLERSVSSVAMSSVVLALPAAIIVGIAYGTALVFACALIAGWTGLFLPRMVVHRLAPGAFL
jgi:hypothetical protein